MPAPRSKGFLATDAVAIRNRYWLRRCMLTTGTQNLHALARLVEPELAWKNELSGQASWPNKWRQFDAGRRSPRAALVDKVAEFDADGRDCRTTRTAYISPLWEVMASSDPSPRNLTRWTGRLLQATRQLSNSGGRSAAIALGSARAPTLVRSDWNQLRRQAGLDALAYLTIAFRLAIRARQRELVLDYGSWLVDMLHLLIPELSLHDVALPMLTFYEEWVLPEAADASCWICPSATAQARIDFILHAVQLHRQSPAGLDSLPADTQVVDKILSGKRGPEVVIALRAVAGSSHP